MEYSVEDLQDSYQSLSRKDWNHRIVKGLATISIMLVFISSIVMFGEFEINQFSEIFFMALFTSFISGISSIGLVYYQRRLVIEDNYQYFITFFESFKELIELEEGYRKLKKEKIKDGKKLAKEGIDSLISTFESWTVLDAPKGLYHLQNSLNKVLEEKIIPIILKGEEEIFLKFFSLMKNQCEHIYLNEISFEDWIKFNKDLETLTKEVKPEKKEDNTYSFSLYLLKPYVVGPLIFSIIAASLFINKTEDYILPLIVSVGVSFAGAAFFATSYVQKFVNKHKKIKKY